MKNLFYLILFFTIKISAQNLTGQVFMRDHSVLYLNQIYVTNLNDMKTILTDYEGNFKIDAKPGDVIRFTSIITDRKDIKVTENTISTPNNLFELLIAYRDIEEVVISNFKASGNLKKDVLALNRKDKVSEIEKMIGLPRTKGNGLPPNIPVAGFSGGGLAFCVNSIYDILSGEKRKQERYYAYEQMSVDISNIRSYFGDDYFSELKIPKNLINNFLQFVYSSDNLKSYLEIKNFEAAKPAIERYLPIYLKRLENSDLVNLSLQKG